VSKLRRKRSDFRMHRQVREISRNDDAALEEFEAAGFLLDSDLAAEQVALESIVKGDSQEQLGSFTNPTSSQTHTVHSYFS